MKYERLFTPGKIGPVEMKNRIVMAPMVMGTAKMDGTPGEQMIRYYEERAQGGVGLIITEATRVDERTGVLAPRQLAMSSDRHIEPFAAMVRRIHRHGAKIFCELHHPGRQTLSILTSTWRMSSAFGRVMDSYWNLFFKIAQKRDLVEKTHLLPPVAAPSDVPCRLQRQKTRALTVKEIIHIEDEFAQAALRVKKAGGDGVELHATHGYLIPEVLSPYTNRRTDEYGGSFENRMRFVTNIIRKIREKCGTDFPLVVRLSVDEFYREIGELENGYTLEEGVRIAKRLEELGVDAIDVSSGTYETMNYWLEPTEFECGWRKNLAKAVREQVRVPVLAANLIRSPEQAEQQLAEGIQDFISLGRPLLADSQWAQKAAANRADDIKRCICCLWCFESMLEGEERRQAGQCTVNPRVCREVAVPMDPPRDGDGRRVIIAGAGPAGLTAAEVLAKRGFQVTVYEKEARAGGQLTLAELPPHKEKLGWCTQDLEHAALKNGAVIEYNHPATAQEILDQKPYAVLVATGAVACKPKGIPGAERENVHTSDYALRHGKDFAGRTVAVVGSGMTGLETAELLADNGAKVFIIEMAENIAPGTYHQHLDRAVPLLRSKGVAILTGQKLSAVDDGSVTFTDTKSGESQTRAADDVVIAIGVEQVHVLYEELKGRQENLFIVGDAAQKGRIASATRAAFDCAWALK